VFEHGLHARDDVLLVSYERMVRDPEREMGRLCGFLGVAFDQRWISHIEARDVPGAPPLEIEPEIRRRCDVLSARLETVAAGRPAIA
jgi:hypothetical protein